MPIDVKIRQVMADDAAELLDWLAMMQQESHPGLLQRETLPSLEQEREWIAPRAEGKTAVAFVAIADEGIVGMAEVISRRPPQMAHCVTLGISVLLRYRGQGLGMRLMDRLHAWVRDHARIERVQLEVLSSNPGAIRFYEQLGYAHEGRRADAVRRGGERIDLVQMSLVP